ncbi:MAG: hypothetical protein ACXV8L_01010 [Ilumatobacteraceae bacterium]
MATPVVAPGRLHDAIAAVQRLHPPAAFVLDDDRWLSAPVERPDTLVQRVTGGSLEQHRLSLVNQPIDLAVAPFRVVVLDGKARSTLLVGAHHAVFDGFGCLELVRQLLLGPRELAPPRPPRQPSVGALPSVGREAFRGVRAGRAVPVRSSSPDAEPGFGFAVRAVPAPPAGWSNERLLATLHQTLATRALADGAPSGASTGVAVAVSLRPLMPGSELRNSSALFPTRVPVELGAGTLEEVEAALRPQTRVLRLGPIGPVARSLADRVVHRGTLPPWSQLAFAEPVVLSNLGRVDRLLAEDAPFGIDYVLGSTPPAPRMAITVVAIGRENGMALCCRNRRSILDDDSAGRLVDELAERLCAQVVSRAG